MHSPKIGRKIAVTSHVDLETWEKIQSYKGNLSISAYVRMAVEDYISRMEES